MDLQATSPVSLSQLLAIQPEHAVPGPGDIVDVTYGRRYEGGELPLSVRVVTDVAGIATFTVTADAEEVAYSMQAARKALVRASGNDPDKPDSLGAARLAMGPQAFAENVVYFTKQRLMCLAYMRTGIMPFLAANYPVSDAPVEGRDFTFVARFRLRPRGVVEDFSPVCLAFPEKREVTDKDLDDFVGQMMGGSISMDSVPEEAKAGMARLRDQARQECESRRDDEWWGIRSARADVTTSGGAPSWTPWPTSSRRSASWASLACATSPSWPSSWPTSSPRTWSARAAPGTTSCPSPALTWTSSRRP